MQGLHATPLDRTPELEPDRLDRIGRLLEESREAGQFSGASWAIYRDGAIAASGAVGTRGSNPDGPVTPDTLFDLASLTKPIATAAAALYLLDRGQLLVGDEVLRYFPGAGKEWEGVTLRHLLTHTSGLPPYAPLYETCRGGDAIRDSILKLGPQRPPGERYDYSCLGYILLQHVIQTIVGDSLARFCRGEIFKPLGMERTTFCPGPELLGDIAVTGLCPHRGETLHGQVHDPLAWAGEGISGNAGLFSSANEVCRFAGMLLSGGQPPEPAKGWILSPAAIRRMLTNQTPPEVGGHSFGFFTVPNGMLPRGDLLPDTTLGHTGFTGTSLVLVPEKKLAAVLLTNCLYHGGEKGGLFRTRRRFHTLVGASLPD